MIEKRLLLGILPSYRNKVKGQDKLTGAAVGCSIAAVRFYLKQFFDLGNYRIFSVMPR